MESESWFSTQTFTFIKWALWLVDFWSRVLIKFTCNPTGCNPINWQRRKQQHVISAWLNWSVITCTCFIERVREPGNTARLSVYINDDTDVLLKLLNESLSISSLSPFRPPHRHPWLTINKTMRDDGHHGTTQTIVCHEYGILQECVEMIDSFFF